MANGGHPEPKKQKNAAKGKKATVAAKPKTSGTKQPKTNG